MLIGLTGLIGSGKSTAAAIFKSMGAGIVDADRIGKDVINSNPPLLKKLQKTFGDQIVRVDGHLNRRRLASAAFVDESSRSRLNRLVHPYLLRELWRQVGEKSKKHEIVVIDAALLLEWKLEKKCDLTIAIHAPREIRLKRLAGRGLNRNNALARERRQLPLSEFRRRCDVVIMNNGSRAKLKKSLLRVLESQ
jgi:dephospho-CoA kinase